MPLRNVIKAIAAAGGPDCEEMESYWRHLHSAELLPGLDAPSTPQHTAVLIVGSCARRPEEATTVVDAARTLPLESLVMLRNVGGAVGGNLLDVPQASVFRRNALAVLEGWLSGHTPDIEVPSVSVRQGEIISMVISIYQVGNGFADVCGCQATYLVGERIMPAYHTTKEYSGRLLRAVWDVVERPSPSAPLPAMKFAPIVSRAFH